MKRMKFIVKSSSSFCGRTGLLSDFPRLPQLSIETPGIMLYTKGGSVPHITREVLDMALPSVGSLLQVPLAGVLHMRAGARAHGGGIAAFAGQGPRASLVLPQEPGRETAKGHIEKDCVPLWTRRGKFNIQADSYMDTMEDLKPDIYLALCDGATDAGSSGKRVGKSAERTAAMFDRCLQRHLASDYLKQNSSLLGVIEGGYNLEQRRRCLEPLLAAQEHLGGFVLDGLNSNAALVEDMTYESVQHIVEAVTVSLPPGKLRVIVGCWNALTVIDLVSAGWDMFDTCLPYLATERGCALVFNFHLDKMPDSDNTDGHNYEINLEDACYKEDFSPLLAGCECLTCSKYSRAYINHLINTRELLYSVLLMIHNLHHYAEFFKSIRSYAGTDKLAQLRALLVPQLVEHQHARQLRGPYTLTSNKRQRRLSRESMSSDEDRKIA